MLFTVLMGLAIAIIVIYASGLIYTFIPKEKVKIVDAKVDTDKRLFKDLSTFDEKVAEALRRLYWEIEDYREDYQREQIIMPNETAIGLFVQFLKDYFIFRDDEFGAYPSVDEGVYIRFCNKYTKRYLSITIYNDGEILCSYNSPTIEINYDPQITELVEDVNDFLNERSKEDSKQNDK